MKYLMFTAGLILCLACHHLYDNHSTSDVWRYYFDRPNRRIFANWVDAGDHYNLVENVSFERVAGILFNQERQSFRIDSLGNKRYLRADYRYDNYVVTFERGGQ